MRLRNRLQRWLFPEFFKGQPQPHERQDLASGPAIEEARKRGVLSVAPMSIRAQLDGDRCLLEFSNGTQVWLDLDGAESLSNVLTAIVSALRKNQIRPVTNADLMTEVHIDSYTFLVHSSKGLFRFDKNLGESVGLKSGRDIVRIVIEFGITPDGDIMAGEGWERAL